MATVKPLYWDSAGDPPRSRQMATTDDIQLAALEILGGGSITLTGGGTITGLPTTPTSSDEAVSKAYADALANGLDPKASVRFATAAALDAYTKTGTGVGAYLEADANGALSVDGGSPVVDDRILVKNEATSDIDHGIYTVTVVGDVGTPWRITRATDFDNDAEVTTGAHCWVEEGTANQKTGWILVTANPITVDTTAMEFTQYAGDGLYSGGDGIAISAGKEITVDLATTPGLEFSSNKLQVKDGNGITVDASGVVAVGYSGITIDANGINVNAGDGLVANAGGDLDIDLSATPGLEFSTGDLQVLVDPAGAVLRQAAGLHVNTDDSTIQINGSNQLEVIGGGHAIRIQNTLTAEEALAKGDCVEWGTTSNQIRECQGSVGARVDGIGIVTEPSGISASGTGSVVSLGLCTNVLVGATVGQRFYIGRTGGLVQGTSSFVTGDHIVYVGTAMSATDLWFSGAQYVTRL